MMQRRTLLKLGAVSAVALVVAGGVAMRVQPGLQDGRQLSPSGRAIFGAVGSAILDGTLPVDMGPRLIALNGLLQRVDVLIGGLPAHARSELSELLAVLGTSPGRRALAGLATDWPEAAVPDVQQALQGMRISRLALRQQAYHALHDIVGAAYFSDAGTWGALGYPGPLDI